MTTVFVSGAYDILHAGHVQFFQDAKSLGDRLVVCVATDDLLLRYKGRYPAMPLNHRVAVISGVKWVDEVVVGSVQDCIFNFTDKFIALNPDVLAVTADDRHKDAKRELCLRHGCRFVVMPKTPPCAALSATDIRRRVSIPSVVPLRVDFAGGWLDVPRLAMASCFVANCAIQPMVSLIDWKYQIGAGVGGSAAKSILDGKDPFKTELEFAGWQDPAVILETGFCVWRSGPVPVLECKVNPDWLEGLMALRWIRPRGVSSGDILHKSRNYDMIAAAGRYALTAALLVGTTQQRLHWLCQAVETSYRVQLDEGMDRLPEVGLAFKYCGSGHGGYALYLFKTAEDRSRFVDGNPDALAVEPYMRGFDLCGVGECRNAP